MTTDQSFNISILVEKTTKEVFEAVNNVRGWWSEQIEGGTEKLNDAFGYHYKDVHSCKIRLEEVIPERKVVWLIEDNDFNFIDDKTEWVGTRVIFEILRKSDNETELRFTHRGLVPQYECYEICRDAWTNYVKNSLRNLITTGKGEPNPREGVGFNARLVEKWGLDKRAKDS